MNLTVDHTDDTQAIDPQYRMQLECVYEALENAGLPLSSVAGSNTSVYSGVWTHDYHDGLMQDGDKLPRFLMIGTPPALAANRISHFFDLRGASLTLDTGCSSGLVALHQAVLGLRAGEADMSVVSGSNLMLSPDRFKMLSSLGMLSPDGKSYAFDSRANGYGRGEGVVTVIIKRLKDAIAAGDPIRAIIRETGVNQDGKTDTITLPSEAAQTELMRECYRRAKLSPSNTQVFEAHGTGTPAGDPIEARAIAAVFGGRTEPLHIGSIKTNIGKYRICFSLLPRLSEHRGLLSDQQTLTNHDLSQATPKLHRAWRAWSRRCSLWRRARSHPASTTRSPTPS
jgi:acyl transferase domain-containing protein